MEVVSHLQSLSQAPRAADAEALTVAESRALMGKGIGYIGMYLLASAALGGNAKLWMLDRRLHGIANKLHLDYVA